MPDQGRRVAQTHRRCTPQQKEQTVCLERKSRAEAGQSFGAVKRVAEQLVYGVKSERYWVRKADIDNKNDVGTTTAEAE